MQEPKLSLYISRLREIGSEATLWPHVDEQITESKWKQVESLDAIAKTITQSHRPTTKLLDETTKLTDITGKVLKREGSESGKHVLIPPVTSLRTDKDVQNLRLGGRYRWLIQDYAPYLISVGEWRVVFCGGQEIYTIQTEPGQNRRGRVSFSSMRVSPHWTCYTLEEMRSVTAVSPSTLLKRTFSVSL